MALSRVTTWSAGQTLTAAALNAEFDNIINGAASLINGVAGSFTTVVASGNSTMTQLTLSGALIKSVTNTITAGSTQSQAGATALTKDINRVTVSGTDGDGVKLPAAVVGAKIEIINDDAAQTIQIWPATGDAIDGGSANAVDANALAAGGDRTYFSVDATNWYTKSSDEPAASATVSGVVELATDAETITGTDTARAVTPANIQAKVAGATVKGIVELATDAETITGTDTARAVTPANIQAKVAGAAAKGIVELATDAETITGTDTARAVTPANIQAKVAGAAAKGIVELATTAETTTGTDTARAVTPEGLHDMTSLAGAEWLLDEDAMGTNSATKVASQQSIKAYVDALGVTSGGSPTFTGLTTTGHTQRSLATGLTAGTTQTMAGALALTKDINIVTVNGNDDDGVALPTAVAGKEVTIVNSDAAQRLQIWPGNGFSDTIDGGSANAVDPNKLAAGGVRTYVADGATNWVTTAAASGAISALNSATANELVTVGATTTELDAETNLTFDGSTLGVTGAATVSGLLTVDAINFGHTDYENFDSYDIIAWTPAVYGHTTAGDINYAVRNGRGVYIGDWFFFEYEIELSSIDVAMAGQLRMSGFPTSAANDGLDVAHTVGVYQNLTPSADEDHVSIFTNPNSAVFTFYSMGSGGLGAINAATEVSGTLILYGSGFLRYEGAH